MTNSPSQAKNNNFLLTLGPLPEVDFWIQDFQLPSLTVELARVYGSALDYSQYGEKPTYDPITFSFIVDEMWDITNSRNRSMHQHPNQC